MNVNRCGVRVSDGKLAKKRLFGLGAEQTSVLARGLFAHSFVSVANGANLVLGAIEEPIRLVP